MIEKTTPRMRGTTRPVQEAARALRQTETLAEDVLWEALRGRRLNGLRFRRQHAVGRFVLDFFCSRHKLAIEVDGGVHDGRAEQDAWRTDYLATYGYRVLRVTNDEVLTDLAGTLDRILTATESSLAEPDRQTVD